MRLFRGKAGIQRLVATFFRSLAGSAISHPRSTLAIAALVTLAAVPGLFRLKLRTDGRALLSKSAPEVLYDRSIREQFGIKDQIVVLIHSKAPEGVFNPGTVQLVRDLTADLEHLPGVTRADLMSLATEPSFRFRPGTLTQQTLLEPPLTTTAELEQLREDLRRIELYTGTLISSNGQYTALLVGVPAGADRTALYRRVSEVVKARPRGPEELAVTGAPVAEALLGIHILEDLGVPKALLGATAPAQSETDASEMPHSFGELRLFIARRIGLVPLAALVMMLVFLVSFRNALAMLLPLPGVAATVVFVFGLMGWFGVPVFLTTAVMPVLLTATGVTNDVYLFSRYFSLLRERPGSRHVELVRETFDKLAMPVAITSLTTGIGFVSFALSPLGPVEAFGVCTFIGVLFGLFYSLTVVPALLTMIPPGWLLSQRRRERGRGRFAFADWFAELGDAVVRWRWWVAGAAVLVTAVTPLGLRRLLVQDSWTDAFAPDSEFHRATTMVNEQFDGMHLLFVSFDAPETLRGEIPASALTPVDVVLPAKLVEDPVLIAGSTLRFWVGDRGGTAGVGGASPPPDWQAHIEMAARNGDRVFLRLTPSATITNFWENLAAAGRTRFEVSARSHVRPEIIRTSGDLGSFLRERPQYAVGGVLGPADYLSTTRFMVRPNEPGSRRLPADSGEAKILWDYYALARGQHRLRQVVDTNYWRSLTTVFLKDANFVDTAKLMRDIRGFERQHLAPKGISVGFAGDVALSQSLIQGIVATQLQSLGLSLAGIYLVTALLGGSWRWGVFCVVPSLLAVIVKLAVMGWLGIPLGVATSMFAAMTFGIGVNCAIQLLEAFRQLRREGASPLGALRGAMVSTGPAALINTIAVSLGFAVLMLSQVPANARLGLLMVLGLTECFVASLLLVPALLHWWPLKESRPAPARSPAEKAEERVTG